MTELFAQQLNVQPNRRETVQRLRGLFTNYILNNGAITLANNLDSLDLKDLSNRLPLFRNPQVISNVIVGDCILNPTSHETDLILKFIQDRSAIEIYGGAKKDLENI